MDKGRTTSDSRYHMNCLGHLTHIRSLFQTGLRKGINAVRTLDGMSHGKGNERLLPFRQLSFRKHGPVVIEKFVSQIRYFLPDLFKLWKVFGFVIGLHWKISPFPSHSG